MRRFLKCLAALIWVVLLTACQTPANSTADGGAVEALTVTLGQTQTTLDSAAATAEGSDTILFHLYENLMRWEDNGDGYAVLAPGQAASYTVETDQDGNATYTFTLREDIKWSDGEAVTAHHFAAAWKRLADPANDLPYREMMRGIAGYDAVQESGNVNLLAVTAPDATTLVVTLTGNAPYFLESVCASAHTMPIRHNPPSSTKIITNGAYTVEEFTSEQISLVKSETYYDAANITVARLQILPAADDAAGYDALLRGETGFVENLPRSILTASEETGWETEAVTTTLAVAFNTRQEPFTVPEVRVALRLAVDQQTIVEALADGTSRAATGLVPCGVSDLGAETTDSTETEEESAEPSAPVRWDFREHSKEIVTVDTSSNYESDCDRARAFLAQAGYPNGEGFPTVEYIFLNTEENAVIARAIQTMWQEQLGISITLRALTSEEYAERLTPVVQEGEEMTDPPFQMAAISLTAAHNDVSAILSRWHSASEDNFIGYASDAFDILLDNAALTSSAAVYDAYFHDAEAILLADAPLIPLCYQGRSFCLAEGMTGLYHAPNGIYFFSHITHT